MAKVSRLKHTVLLVSVTHIVLAKM